MTSTTSKVLCVVGGIAAAAVVSVPLFYYLTKRNDHHIAVLLRPDNTLTPEFRAKLTEIFFTLDKDGDGALNEAEMDNLVFMTEGVHLTPEMSEFIRANFETNNKGWLTLPGFLASYQWIVNNVDDRAAEEALAKDLRVYGYTYTQFKTSS
ncbi:Mitochondrial Rho GTPase [Balamuthia mandrillaris]